MTISQELFNTLMSALHAAQDNTDLPGIDTAMQSLADMYPEQRKVWWSNNSWKFNGFPE
jgi:uncharacterized protein YqfB (UPF0267 family)